MIARRKRMLQTFLNRIARHPILSNEHVFHRFLDGEVSWVCDETYPVLEDLFLHLPSVVRGSAFPTIVFVAQEHSQGTFTQSDRPDLIASVCCIAQSVSRPSTATTRSAFLGL